MKTKNKNTFKNNYLLSFKFIGESKTFIYIIALLFLFSAIFGFIFPVFFSEIIRKFLQDIIEKTAEMNFVQLIAFIIQNNLKSSLIAVISGILLGVFPIIIALVNGYFLGFVANKSVLVSGYSVLARLLPHGIFELPALIISLGIGLKLGTVLFAKNKSEALRYNIENSLRVFIFIVLPLLIIAGIIEGLLIWLIS